MATKVQIKVAGATRKGSRKANEDFMLVLTGDRAPCGTMALLSVADGIGGLGNGADASRLALKTVADVFAAGCCVSISTLSDVPHLLRFAVQKANAAVFQAQMADDRLKGMGTTCVAAAITPEAVHIVSVGDSRAYILRRGELLPLTHDEWTKLDDGVTVVSRAVGWQPVLPTEPISNALESGDIVLLCTDGLTDALDDDAIAEVLDSTDFDTAADALVDAAAATPQSDNATVVLAAIR